jgi:tRNA modification GTPase
MSDTIAAIATAYGSGAISIVRISGEGAIDIAKKLTHRSSFKNRYAHLCDIYDHEHNLIDQVIVIAFFAPNSFTTEDVIEIQTHGGIAVSHLILKLVLSSGARAANPGEFTKRAYLGGRIDLSEAEAISAMIEAKSEDAIKLLANQMKGSLKVFVDTIREQLIEILAHIEVNIDYAEEDLPQDMIDLILSKVDLALEQLHMCKRDSNSRTQILDGYKVAIIGKPNVGKSSLLNSLLNYERAIISEIEGTTRDSIEESIKVGTHIIKIIDTAGIRETSEAIEKIGVERARSWASEADIIIALFDGSRPKDSHDEKIIELLQSVQKETIVLINKSDLEQRFDQESLQRYHPITYSCKEKSTFLFEKLQEILDTKSSYSDQILISSRQVTEVENALSYLQASKISLQSGELEIFALEVNRAILSISAITKSFENDEMLDKMFGSFCLGK